MKIKNQKGKMILFEGLDGAGKTTISKHIIKNMDMFYCKGVGSNTFLGRAARKFAKTFLFLLELIYITHFSIKPALKKGKFVLQDKYIFFVASHIPDVETILNKLLIKLTNPLLIEPDLIIYFQVSVEQRIKRLTPSVNENRFHKILINNPWLITAREKKYEELLAPYQDKTIFLDTTNKTIEQVIDLTENELRCFIRKENEKWF